MRCLILGLALGLVACSESEPELISAGMVEADGIPSALTEAAGDPDRGKITFVSREGGHCVLCHGVASLDAEFQGDVGPALDAVGDRLSAAQLRLRIADYQIIRPGTLMPSYYRNHDLYQVGAAYKDGPILTAQEVEDLVAYLATLTESG
jgi:sulfur-oxidizing protein SoxX